MAAFKLSSMILILIYFIYGAMSDTITAPNILFIMADDLGWGNLGFHNAQNPQISTPNMDNLVMNEGLELMRHYVSKDSMPTRSSFQSGRLPIHVNSDRNNPFDPLYGLPSSMTTIATKLRDSEYAYNTHMVGKWDCGFATYSQLPTRRGYDSFYGYLSNNIDYYLKSLIPKEQDNNICGDTTTDSTSSDTVMYDLWDDEEPVYTLDDAKYSEYSFSQRVIDIIDQHGIDHTDDSNAQPFFIMYSSHLPHSPLQLPQDYVNSALNGKPSENDENLCTARNQYIYPNIIDPTHDDDIIGQDFQCRQLLQAQVNLLDQIIGNIVDRLKENGLWDNTLLILTTDNGGSLELDSTAGNNYPLRGGKYSELEGGIRATTFISGGYLPESRRGQKEYGLTHVSDWYRTFCEMMGIDATDYMALDEGIPDVDGYNLWPLISGEVVESPRTELIISHDVFISGEYKLNIGNENNKYAIWQGEVFPNDTTPSQDTLEAITLNCADNEYRGCLFNVMLDPSEHTNLVDIEQDQFLKMKARLDELKEGFYKNEQEGIDSCPAGYNIDDENENCGCWMAQNNYHQFAGPYQDLTESQQHWEGQTKETHGLHHTRINFHSFIILVIIACSVVICGGSLAFCYKMKEQVFNQEILAPIPHDEAIEGLCPDETTPLIQHNNMVPVPVQN